MPGPVQMLQHLKHRTGNAIDVWEEGLGHHCDLHTGSTAALPEPVGEPSVSCRLRAREQWVMGAGDDGDLEVRGPWAPHGGPPLVSIGRARQAPRAARR